MEFMDLPNELVIHIIVSGGPSVAGLMAQCSRSLLNICSASYLWYQLCRIANCVDARRTFSEAVDWKDILRCNTGINGNVFTISTRRGFESPEASEATLLLAPDCSTPITVTHYAAGWESDYLISNGVLYEKQRSTSITSIVQVVGDVACLTGNNANFAWIAKADRKCYRVSGGTSTLVFDFPVKTIACMEDCVICIDLQDNIHVRYMGAHYNLVPGIVLVPCPDLGIRGTPVSVHASQSYFVVVASSGDMAIVDIIDQHKNTPQVKVGLRVRAESEDDYPVSFGCGVGWFVFITRASKVSWDMDDYDSTPIEIPGGPWKDCCFGNTVGVALHKNGSVYSLGSPTVLLNSSILFPPDTVVKRVFAGYFHVVFISSRIVQVDITD